MHSESEIRPLREEDIPAVLALSKKRIRHGFLDGKGLRDYLDSPLLKGLVLTGESVQGYLLYRVGVEESEIDEIAIEETIEGTGSGARLLASCLSLSDSIFPYLRNFISVPTEFQPRAYGIPAAQ